jgi:hypothetical protein
MQARSEQSLSENQLRIEVLRGENAVHAVREPSGIIVEVAVYDEKDRPLPGATVALLAPQNGAGARFLNDSSATQAVTDERGIAHVAGLRGNRVPGTYQVRISASFGGKSATANLTQTNQKSPLITRRRAILLGAVAAAAIPVAIRLSSSSPQATISTATPSGPVGP